MANTCIHCGHENEDSAFQCVCGCDLPTEAASVSAHSAAIQRGAMVPLPANERSLRGRKIVFVLWAMAFVPLFAAIGSRQTLPPLHLSLIGTGIFGVPAVAALWFLGHEKQPALRDWRFFLVAWALLVLPLLLTVAAGLAAQGWPDGKINKPIAHLLILILTLTIPAFLTSVCSLIRAHRVTSVLALVTGLIYLVNGGFLIRATAPAKALRLKFETVLDLVLIGCQMASYFSIPIGIGLIVGGVMTFRMVRARAGNRLR